jgi:VanZ family protein
MAGEFSNYRVDDPRASPLARYLLAAYVLLIVYASLNPFEGWREVGTSPFEFLGAPFPRYIVTLEVAANIAAYIPLGFLVFLALRPLARGVVALVISALSSALLSLTVECLQNYLPTRVPSNIDLAANALGALAGAIIALVFAARLSREQGLQALRYRYFQEGARVDLGLALIALWLLSLLYPGTFLFGNGDLRALFTAPSGALHPSEAFIRFEALVTAANTVAVGMLLSLLTERGQPARRLFLALLAGAIAARTIAYGLLFSPQDFLNWLTPGATYGLTAGSVIVLIFCGTGKSRRTILCGLALMSAPAVVNYAPENPYFLAAIASWQQGHFLNFNGFTRMLSAAWPFIALLYVLALTGARGR